MQIRFNPDTEKFVVYKINVSFDTSGEVTTENVFVDEFNSKFEAYIFTGRGF